MAFFDIEGIEFINYQQKLCKKEEIMRNLGVIEQLSSAWDENPELEQMRKYNEIKEKLIICESNAFEGIKISLKETIDLMNEYRASTENNKEGFYNYDSLAKRQVVQHHLAWKYLCGHDGDLTEDLIKEAHRILMRGLGDENMPANEGQYRTEPTGAGNHVFVDPQLVPSRMTRLVTEYNEAKSFDACLLAGWLMAEFLTIQPFNDGNGSLSRLLFNYALPKCGVPVFVGLVGDELSKDYMAAIEAYQRYASDSLAKYASLWTHSVNCIADSWSNFYCSYSRAGNSL